MPRTYYCDRPDCEMQWINVRRKKCELCGHVNRVLKRIKFSATHSVTVTPDVPEHFNLSLNQPVRSRRHLRDLQKRHGTQDYEGIRGADLHHVFGPGGEMFTRSKAPR